MLQNKTEGEHLQKKRNILLLGQTGVGKSTFINALENYLHFNDFDSSVKSDLNILVPCQFTLHDEDLKANIISCGSDSNEQLQPGQSSTQKCKVHEIPYNEYLIRIFDTPGIGDTRGVEQDQINLKNILEIIKDYDELHCICILLKPNESKLSTSFEYCIKQLLNLLPKNAILNIVFVFTNSRETFYRPGETVVPLQAIFSAIEDESPNVKIAFEKNNVFCIDNAGFRYIIAKKKSNIYSSTQEKEMSECWKRSRKECIRLVNCVTNGQEKSSIQIQDIMCLNEARKCAAELLQPLIKALKNYENNRRFLKEQIIAIEELKDINKEKQKLLPMLIVRLKYTKLSYPHTVCSSGTCAQAFKVGDTIKYHHWRFCCHEKSEHSGNNSNAEYENIFDEKTGICNQCGCHSSQHTSTNYDSRVEEEKILDEESLETETSDIGERMIEKLESKMEKYKSEEEELFKNIAKLVVFIQQNSIMPYKDVFESNIRQIIQENSQQSNVNLDSLLETHYKNAYLENSQKSVSNSSVLKVIDKLNAIEENEEILTTKVKDTRNNNDQLPKWIQVLGFIVLLAVALAGLIILIVFLTKE